MEFKDGIFREFSQCARTAREPSTFIDLQLNTQRDGLQPRHTKPLKPLNTNLPQTPPLNPMDLNPRIPMDFFFFTVSTVPLRPLGRMLDSSHPVAIPTGTKVTWHLLRWFSLTMETFFHSNLIHSSFNFNYIYILNAKTNVWLWQFSAFKVDTNLLIYM